MQGYSNINFVIQHLTVTDDDVHHFYLQDNKYGCYQCIVNAKYLYDLDDIIAGNVPRREEGPTIDNTRLQQIRKAYLTALARERYNLYKTNGYFGIN